MTDDVLKPRNPMTLLPGYSKRRGDEVSRLAQDFAFDNVEGSDSESGENGPDLSRWGAYGVSKSRGGSCPNRDDGIALGAGTPVVLLPQAAPEDSPSYEIMGELGRGGMGVVYKAREIRLNRIVALKMVLAGTHATPEAIQRFRTEAETVAQLHHPNIVQIHSIGQWDGLPYIELEYIEGGNLAGRLGGSPWQQRDAASLIESLARAIHDAHRLGIVHRDLKPANILLTRDQVPKISDFGLAKSIENDSGLTRTESILGSPSYMAPEQAEGNRKDVGPLADVYSLGVILYEMLTGRAPFCGASLLETLDMVKNAEPVPPTRLVAGLSRDLETICLKCLQKAPNKRYGSAQELADDLDRYLHYKPILARPILLHERLRKWVRRHPTTSASSAIAFLALLAALSGWLWYSAKVHHAQQRESQRMANLREQVSRSMVLGREALARDDLVNAKTHLSGAVALIAAEPSMSSFLPSLEQSLGTTNQKIAAKEERESSLARQNSFRDYRDQALFFQSKYTGMEPDANLRGLRQAARQALALFGLDKDAPVLVYLENRGKDDADRREIRWNCYELLVILAEATAQPLAGEVAEAQAKEALRILDRAVQVHPPTALYHSHRAVYLERAHDPESARHERLLANQLAQGETSALDEFLQGEECCQRNEWQRAIVHLKQVLSHQPDHFWGQYLLAICHLKLHQFSEAQAALIASQSRRPDFIWVYLLKGFAEGEMGEFALADEDYRRALDMHPGEDAHYVLLVNRGVTRVREKRLSEAVGDFQAAIKLKPANYQAYVDLVQAYQSQGNWKGALKNLEKAISIQPGQVLLHRLHAQIQQQNHNDQAALKDLDQALRVIGPDDPQGADIQFDRAQILHRRRQFQKALDAYERGLALKPDHLTARRLRGAVLMQLKRYREAERDFDFCVSHGKVSAGLLEARGLARACQGRYAQAVEDYTVALKQAGETSPLFANRGWAYLFSGAARMAERDFSDAIRLDRNNGDAQGGRGLALVQIGKTAEAVEAARLSVRLRPDDARVNYNAARVYCQAASIYLATPGRLSDRDFALMKQCKAEAVSSVKTAVEKLPETDRSRFWREVVAADATLTPIRDRAEYRSLQSLYTLAPGGISQARPHGSQP